MNAIICAMNVEYTAIKKFFHDAKEFNVEDNFLLSVCRRYDLLIIRAGIGRVNAYNSVSYIINKYQDIDYCISVGIAGAYNDFLQIGDIVVSNCVLQPDNLVGNRLKIDMEDELLGGSKKYKTKRGYVLCCNYFVSNKEQFGDISGYDVPICIDMESIGVWEACQENSRRFIAVKIISDYADSNSIQIPMERVKKLTNKLGSYISEIIVGLRK